ncbi:MAG TPA: hypothetical protein VFJ51_04090 [Nitrososphaeraceae archaeon]|nr:hypothetical protein [Nitrososphaeraceae archaeon]
MTVMFANSGHEKLRYDKIIKSYNEARGYCGIKGLNPFEMFLEIN